jgi:hypothetical protein
MKRWGAGGARLVGVHVGEPSPETGIDLTVTFEASELDRGVICVGFVDEGGNEIAAVESPLLAFATSTGSVQCRVTTLPLRPGLYFPVVGILSSDGTIRDRWQLDRPISITGNGRSHLADFGAVALNSDWSEPSSENGQRRHGEESDSDGQVTGRGDQQP